LGLPNKTVFISLFLFRPPTRHKKLISVQSLSGKKNNCHSESLLYFNVAYDLCPVHLQHLFCSFSLH